MVLDYPKYFVTQKNYLVKTQVHKKLPILRRAPLKKIKERMFPRNNKNIWNLMH